MVWTGLIDWKRHLMLSGLVIQYLQTSLLAFTMVCVSFDSFYNYSFSNNSELGIPVTTSRVTRTIDPHIAKNSVDPESQIKPYAALQTPNPDRKSVV